jgi:hypothetical protein
MIVARRHSVLGSHGTILALYEQLSSAVIAEPLPSSRQGLLLNPVGGNQRTITFEIPVRAIRHNMC